MEPRQTILTAEYLRSVLHYDPDTGVFTWLPSRAGHWRTQPGTEAGSVRQNGHRTISILCRTYTAHHLAWLYVHGELPARLAHADRDPLNNRLDNLRRVVRGQPLTTANLMDRIIPEPNSGCWIWLGSLDRKGYGRVGAYSLAHRRVYEQLVRPIPKGLFCCHHCDTPACVNPEHLFLGTADDNTQDMIRKGRYRPANYYTKRAA